MTKDATGTVIENRDVMITSQWLKGGVPGRAGGCGGFIGGEQINATHYRKE
jgi:hypothetical protein